MKKKRKSRLKRVLKLRAPKRLARVRIPKIRRRGQEADTKLVEAIQNLPRITNETVAEHREEVLSSARKYIYPLSHSKRRVVSITVGLLVVVVLLFFGSITFALYKLQSTSTFVYAVTRVIPFPVAKAGPSWVSYESYLFELRHTMHYYQTQAQPREDFNNPRYKKHLVELKQQAMAQVIQDAYVKQLASKHHVSVSSREVSNEVTLVRQQNRLGSNDRVFRDVLSEFWGWTPDDFKRELKGQMLAQKVVSKLDTATQQRATTALKQLQAGADFAALAQQASDDTSTKANGGDYGIAIDRSNSDIAPVVTDALFKLKPGQLSGIIDTGYSLEIDKVTSVEGSKVRASHIVFNFQPLSKYTDPFNKSEPPHRFIKIAD